MTLTKSSCLHVWSSRYGINPIIGGRPVFSRNSAGLFTAQSAEVDSAIINTPRGDWTTVQLPGGLTERRRLLTLELARSNTLVAPSDLNNAAWVKTTMAVATGIADPAGGTSACTLTATAANATTDQNLGSGSSLARVNSVWLRRRTGSGLVKVLKPDGSAYATVTLTSDWQRFSQPGSASVVREAGINIVTNGDAVDNYLHQMEDGPFATSGILAGSGASRAADSLYWNFPPVPQAMMMYVRFVEQGTILLTNTRVLQIGSAAGAAPLITLYQSGAYYTAHHNNNAGGTPVSVLAVAPAIGDTVELLHILFADGSVQAVQSINGAAVTSGAASAAATLAGAWSDTLLLANRGASSDAGANKFAELKIVKYADVVASTAQGRMDEMRSLELGPNGDLL